MAPVVVLSVINILYNVFYSDVQGNFCIWVLEKIRPDITIVNLVGDTIDPEITRLCRGAYFYNIVELYGVGKYGEQTYNID